MNPTKETKGRKVKVLWQNGTPKKDDITKPYMYRTLAPAKSTTNRVG